MSESDETYLIVEFPHETGKKKTVELIPKSWHFSLNGKLMCFYPPIKNLKDVPQLVEDNVNPDSRWPTYEIKIISEAKNYRKGIKKLKKSFRTIHVDSTDDSENNPSGDELLTPLSIIDERLSIPVPMTSFSKFVSVVPVSSRSTDGDNLEQTLVHAERANNQVKEPQDLNVLFEDLKEFIRSEIVKAKRSILYDIDHKITELKTIMAGIQIQTSEQKHPWAILNTELPIDELDKFLEFENELNTNEEKQQALKEYFKLAVIGSQSYERDVQNIICKVIKKSVQLCYSGTGRVVKGSGKRSFKETKTYAYMSEVLLIKYKDSPKQLNILTVTSHYLSGAKDREGGRIQRATAEKI